jgi:hypothetical protein
MDPPAPWVPQAQEESEAHLETRDPKAQLGTEAHPEILTPVPPEDPAPWMAAVELHKPATANLPKDPSSRKTSVPLTSLHTTALLRPLTTGWKSITFMVLGLHSLKHLDASLPLISLTLPLLGGQDSHNQNAMIKLRNGLS